MNRIYINEQMPFEFIRDCVPYQKAEFELLALYRNDKNYPFMKIREKRGDHTYDHIAGLIAETDDSEEYLRFGFLDIPDEEAFNAYVEELDRIISLDSYRDRIIEADLGFCCENFLDGDYDNLGPDGILLPDNITSWDVDQDLGNDFAWINTKLDIKKLHIQKRNDYNIKQLDSIEFVNRADRYDHFYFSHMAIDEVYNDGHFPVFIAHDGYGNNNVYDMQLGLYIEKNGIDEIGEIKFDCLFLNGIGDIQEYFNMLYDVAYGKISVIPPKDADFGIFDLLKGCVIAHNPNVIREQIKCLQWLYDRIS